MAFLSNVKNNVSVKLNPILKDEFGIKCDLVIKTNFVTFDYKDVSDCNKYFSHENINYLKKDISLFENIERFEDETLVSYIYPIDMFFSMDIYKSSNDSLLIELDIPMGVYTNTEITGYSITVKFDVSLIEFRKFLINFYEETMLLN